MTRADEVQPASISVLIAAMDPTPDNDLPESPASPDTERRLTDLEVKASFTEDLLDQLNQTIFRQQQMIDRLARDLAALRDQVPEDSTTFRSLRDELPPHY